MNTLKQKTKNLKIVKCKIGDLFDAIEKLENNNIEYNQFYRQKSKIRVKDEHGEWIDVNQLVKKRDRHVIINDNLIVGYKHKFGNGKFANELNTGDTIPTKNGPLTITNKTISFEEKDVFDWEVDSSTHLYQDANGIIHHNTGKSLLKYVLAAETIRRGGIAYDIDTEDAANKEFVKKIANDKMGDIVSRIQSIEGIETIEDMKTILLNIAELKIAKKDDTPVFVSVDSISQLSSEKEMEDSVSGGSARDMTKAQAMRSVFRTISRKLRAANITLMLIAHTSMKIGGFGNPVTAATHGGGPDFAASLILWLTSNKELIGTGKVKVPIGARMRFQVKKNRTVYKGRKADVSFSFNSSILRYSGLLEILNEYGVVGLSSKEITPRTKVFVGVDGKPFESKSIKKNDVEEYEKDGWTIVEDKFNKDGTEKKNPTYKAIKGEEFSFLKMKDWIKDHGGDEVVINNWNDSLNKVMEGLDPSKDDPEFFEEDEEEMDVSDIEGIE